MNNDESSADITYLEVPPDAEAHARRFGAQRDASGYWYVTGEVHRELLNYLPRQSVRRFHDSPPGCPLCGSGIRKSINPDGDLQWVCMARFRTGCPGFIDYVDHLDKVAPVSVVGDFLPRLFGSLLLPEFEAPNVGPIPNQRKPHPLHQRWLKIVSLAFAALGSEKQVMRWLNQTKVKLDGEPPIKMLGTKSGCDAVQRLLAELWL